MNKNQTANNKTLIAIDLKRGFELTTPLPPNEYQNQFKKLFPKRKSIALIEVFDTINKKTGFINSFEHVDYTRKVKKPEPIYFYGNLVECCKRKGLKKIAEQFGNLTRSKLEKTFRTYFTSENLKQANKCVKRFIDDIELSNLPETGNDPYYFTDKKELLPHPVSLCCSEIEFPYAIDRLIGNKSAPIEEDDILIKDPMACKEVLFGIADLLGYSYTTRITDFSKFNIYGDGKNITGILKPDAPVNTNLMEKNWDEMLRFIATIKTGYTSAAILIPKLINQFEDPMFLGLRELGKIRQTLFILKYIDNMELRQIIESHLGKADIYKKMSASIQKTRRESEFISYESRKLNDACKVLIENCIFAWNYLYLLDKTKEESSNTDELLKIIRHGYVPVWQHIDTMT